ncbi:MAG TPA: protein phosphatase 2C domain-containing protein [Vicinamibacterales bacterium]|nr:protein phosphatase 2C domain-containing protein [Vicinamibacterales bacterium]
MIRAFGVSDAGSVRKTNEDKFVSSAETGLFAVADGMGGHKAGEVAAQLAIDAITGFISRSANDYDVTWPYGIDDALSFDGNRLRTAIFLANRKVFRAAESSDDYGGMGTTIVGLLITGSHAAIGSVGDSRVYLLAEGHLEQVTTDDSWAATILAQDPKMRPEDVANHPMRNVLTNVLGARDQVDVHLAEHDVWPGDTILLCSDGLHGALEIDEISGIVAAQPDVQRVPHQLVDAALDRGGRDNVTALVVRYTGERG